MLYAKKLFPDFEPEEEYVPDIKVECIPGIGFRAIDQNQFDGLANDVAWGDTAEEAAEELKQIISERG